LHIHVNVHRVLHSLLPSIGLGKKTQRSQEAKRAKEKKRFLNHSEQLFIHILQMDKKDQGFTALSFYPEAANFGK
jgi:hypothetical protein